MSATNTAKPNAAKPNAKPNAPRKSKPAAVALNPKPTGSVQSKRHPLAHNVRPLDVLRLPASVAPDAAQALAVKLGLRCLDGRYLAPNADTLAKHAEKLRAIIGSHHMGTYAGADAKDADGKATKELYQECGYGFHVAPVFRITDADADGTPLGFAKGGEVFELFAQYATFVSGKNPRKDADLAPYMRAAFVREDKGEYTDGWARGQMMTGKDAITALALAYQAGGVFAMFGAFLAALAPFARITGESDAEYAARIANVGKPTMPAAKPNAPKLGDVDAAREARALRLAKLTSPMG